MMTRVTVVALLSLLVVACGDDDGGTGGGAGNTGGGGSEGAGSSGAGSAGGDLGLKKITCDKSPSKCQIYGESTDEGVASRTAACTEGGGQIVEHCPAEGLAGCCLIGGVGSCIYDASVAPTVSGVCAQQGGKWSTSAP